MAPPLDPEQDAGWLRTVAAEVRTFDRSSTAERVAELLRHRVMEGDLPPGTRLSEEQLVEVLQVSRNTLREAFRLLTHEGLLVHRLHRGVFVPELDEEDLVDLYRLRRTIECDVVRRLDGLDPVRLRPLQPSRRAAVPDRDRPAAAASKAMRTPSTSGRTTRASPRNSRRS